MAEIADSELRRLQKKEEDYDSVTHWVWLGCKVVAAAVVFIVCITFTYKAIAPILNLHQANTENQAVIKEQKAHSQAAEYAAQSLVTQAHAKAEAAVIEAGGLAKSQAIIAETLTPEYLHYLYIEAIRDNPNQVIYIPTEAGFPIVEAGRAVQPEIPVTTTTP
jgi:hypothetical protein